MMIYENLGESMKINGKFMKVYENLFNGVTGHSPWGHMGPPRHIGTKTMRMNKLGQIVTAVVDGSNDGYRCPPKVKMGG